MQKELAAFVNKEAAYLLNFGYQGMVSTIDRSLPKLEQVAHGSFNLGPSPPPGASYTICVVPRTVISPHR